MTEDSTLLSLIGEDKYAIAYRPNFTALTDSALAAILLQEMIHFWKLKDGKPFYKFKEECTHDKYKGGDSWCEATGFNKHEFDTALKVIGTKIKKGVSKNDILATDYPERKPDEEDDKYYERFMAALRCCVIYWTDRQRLTWYQINEPLLCKFIHRIYIDKNNGARYLKKCIVASRSKKSWEQRRKDSTEVTHEETIISPVVRYQYFIPALLDAITEQQKPAQPKPNDFLQAISKVFGIPANAGQIKRYASMLNGTAKVGEWKEFRCDPPVTTEELYAWDAWVKRTHEREFGTAENKLKKPEKVQASLYTYREAKARQAQRQENQADRVINLPDDYDPSNPEHYRMMVAEMKRVNGIAS